MVDNFDLVIPLLKFDNPENFYFVQVIQRKKDHKEENKRLGRNNNARLIKAYYINSLEKLMEHKDEMIKLAEVFNARVGINLNPRNRKQVAMATLVRVADSIASDVYDIAKAYNSSCGASLGTDKTWIVDLDRAEDELGGPFINRMLAIEETIISLEPNPGKSKVLARIPTKNGIHLITTAFNSQKFGLAHPGIDIHKNNPTILYIPDPPKTLLETLNELYTEVKHGDDEHQK